MSTTTILFSIVLFLVAGLLEIGGGYLVWQWLREGAAVGVGLSGAALLILYGIVPTFQPAHFGRVYAAYGGVFVVGSLIWSWAFDGRQPDAPDVGGALLCVAGVAILMYWPRG